MAHAGVPLAVIQGILGHSDVKTTMRYVRVLDGTKRRAVLALEKGGEKDVVKIRSNETEKAS
jgi:site-specific recombinase XerD